MQENNKYYNALLIDSVNLAYKTFKHKDEIPCTVGKKTVYKESICKFIRTVENFKDIYLTDTGDIYLLFDNYFSKADLRSTFMFADRKQLNEAYKATRKKENKEFYNSLNFIRYYYLIAENYYHTLRLENLEADDLVEPLLRKLGYFNPDNNKTALFITNDLDWTRYLSSNIDWLPKLGEGPKTADMLSEELGFPVTKNNIIMYKAIFGDPSDNISGLLPENTTNLVDFINLLPNIEYPEVLILMSRDTDLINSSKILNAIHLNERAYLVNLQLVSSIPCSVDALSSTLTTGRFAETLFKVVREAIGLEGPQEFVFGNTKRPRVS